MIEPENHPDCPGSNRDPLSDFHAHVEPDVWETLVRWRREGRRVVLVSVAATHGMTPRKAGARMLCAEDGATCGSVGGGALEQAALAAATELFGSHDNERTLHWQLTQELGMCCGGEMVVRLEALEPS